MPSSFTTNGGIELPANGEQDGIWGDTVNDNMQIIDRLTNGVGAIALSGTTHTLTTLNGEVSDGQYAVLVFGGSPSGTNTVTISPNDAQHVYIVRNTTAQSIVLTQGSGGNVTVAAGKAAIVACDGAGSVAAVTDITAGFSFQGASAALTAISGLAVTDGNFIVGNGTTWVAESGDTVLTSIGVTATTTELNVLDGIPATLTSTELGYVDGVTSAIQTQLDSKAPLASPTFTNDVTISDTAPELVFVDTNGSSGLSQTALVQDANKLQFETRNSSGVFVGRDYVIEKALSGAQTHIFYLNDTERFRFAATGALGLNGENYGTSGQVLTSNGIAASPSWQTPTGAVAFGRVNGTGVVSASYNLASANWYSTGACRVTFSSSLGTSAYVALAGHYDSSAATPLFVWAFPGVTATGNFVDVFLKNASGTAVTDVFQIVCFKP